ncbi:hypothetical protein [Halalkalibacterium halodurans]|uniref:hypothetical protein n=1 Tax=Halalkalibacterium halodurans TaxID=86665 RepID=UPI0038B418E5
MAVVGISIALVGGLPLAIVGAHSWELSPIATGLIQAIHIMSGIAGGGVHMLPCLACSVLWLIVQRWPFGLWSR